MAKVAVRRSVQYLVYDTFAGSGALTDHAPDVAPSGASWAVLWGGFNELSAGLLTHNPAADGSLALIATGAANGELEALCRASGGGSGLTFRSNADGSRRFDLYLNYANDRLELRKYTTLMTSTLLSSATGGVPLTENTSYKLTVLLRDQLCRFLVDDIYKHDIWTTDYQTNDFCGVCRGWASAWDDFIMRPAATWKELLFFGDSISLQTDDHNAAFTTTVGVGSMWPSRMAGGYNVSRAWAHSVAVGGASVYGNIPGRNFADQLPLATGSPADMIFCMFGTNTPSTNPDVTSEYQSCLQGIKAEWAGVPIYCLGVLATTATEYSSFENRATINAKMQAAAVAEGATFWDCEGWIDPAIDTYDGLHPNAAGNAKIAAQVLTRL